MGGKSILAYPKIDRSNGREPELPSLRHLNGFSAVVACGSVSAATGPARLSQPALTQAIAKLEKRVGALLFDRLPAGMIPTPSGERLARRVDRGFQMLEKGEAAIGSRQVSRMLSLSQLRALLTVVELGGFRAAAAQLGCEGSTVNRACRELEALLGVPLFERTSSGFRATQQADVLARSVRLALAEFREGFFEIAGLQGQMVGRLGIGCLPLAQAAILPKALARFAAEYPTFDIRVVDGYYAGLSQALLSGDIDLIIGALRLTNLPQGLVQETLFEDPLAVIARHDHPLAGRQRLTVEDLRPFGWVAPRTGAPSRVYFDRLMRDIAQEVAVAPIETGAPSVMRGILMSTDRMALVSLAQVREEIVHRQLARIAIELEGSSRPIGITVRDNWEPSPPKQRFLQLIRTVATGT